MSVLHDLIADVENAFGKIRQHLAELGHEAAVDATELVAQAKETAGPVIATAEADAHQLADEAVTDAKDVAATFATGGIVSDPGTTEPPASSEPVTDPAAPVTDETPADDSTPTTTA